MISRARAFTMVAGISAAFVLTACASTAGVQGVGDENPRAGTGTASTQPGEALTGELTVYAAASLTAAFDELAAKFEQRHPSLDVLPIVYDGSSTLATQLIEGAPADVFAAADEKTMAMAADADLLAGEPVLFAANTLVIAMPAGNPAGIEDLADLGEAGIAVVLCAPDVPCGVASRTLLANAGVTVDPASLEQNVTAVLTKVAADEADAGLVYRTDAAGRTDVESITPEGAAEVVNRYPIAALARARNPEAAAQFAAFVAGAEGRAVLAGFGFGSP